MKLTIKQDKYQQETEIVITCPYVDKSLQKIIDYITQHTFSIEGESAGKIYQLPIDRLYYIESVEGKTFLYDETNSYYCKQALYTLGDRLAPTPFTRVSKNCLLNTSYLKCIEPYATIA